MKKVGFLSTQDSPLLPHFVYSSKKLGVSQITLILDRKAQSPRDRQLWEERTGGLLDDPDLKDMGDYLADQTECSAYRVDNHNGQDCVELIKSSGFTCLLNAGTPRKLSKAVLASTKLGVINIHPGVLPKYRGCSAVEWAIFNDDAIGNTAHFMSDLYDQGPIIEIETYQFSKDASYQSIRTHVYKRGFELAARILTGVIDSALTTNFGLPQDDKSARTWLLIPDSKLEQVRRKVAEGRYKYQRL